jgi:large subunit ribosomal protein L10
VAISKQKKEELVDQYADWMDRSNAFILTEYAGLTMKDVDELRQKSRESGGEFHIVKNTLGKLAFEKIGVPVPESEFVGTTAIAFAFDDPAAMAKVVSDFEKESDFLSIKSGYLEKEPIDVQGIRALADLPPMPVVQAQLLGVLMSPANKLAGLLAEPARQISTVLNAYSKKEEASEAAT